MEAQALPALSTDQLEQFLVRSEAAIARVRAAQLALLAEVDRRQVPLADGCRTLTEWIAGRMDVAPETATALVQATRGLEGRPALAGELARGWATFDRVAAIARGHGDELALHLDIAGIRRRLAAKRRVSRSDERRTFCDRYLMVQPSLDEASWRIHGQFPSVAGRVVEQALHERGDTLGDLPDGTRLTRGQRNADALVAMAADSLDRDGDHEDTGSGATVTLFVDATDQHHGSRAAAEVAYGPRSRMDPDSLPGRRRFLRPRGPDPP